MSHSILAFTAHEAEQAANIISGLDPDDRRVFDALSAHTQLADVNVLRILDQFH